MSKSQSPVETEALETITERLQKSRLELLEENERHTANTKGKAKATEQDEEKEAEFIRKIDDIDNAILDVQDSGQNIMYKVRRKPISATFDPGAGPMSTRTSYKSGITVDEEDEEAIWNPITSSFAYRETGFEPGPSGLSGDPGQIRQDLRKEQGVLTETSLEIKMNFAESSPLWLQYPEQPQQQKSKHIHKGPAELHAGTEFLPDDPPTTERREVAVQDFDLRDGPISRSSQGNFAFVANAVRSCKRWLFGSKSAPNDANQGFHSRTKSPSEVESSRSSRSAMTSFGTSLSSASLPITDTPRTSVSFASSRRDVLQRVKRKISHRRYSSHSEGTRDDTKRRVRDASPIPASFVFPYEHDSTSFSEPLRQNRSESLFPQPQRLSLQQQEHGSDQEWYTMEHQERGMQHSWSEDETLLLALALEEEEKAKTKDHELSHRLAMSLQLQEDRELAERQELLESEWLHEVPQLLEAVLERDPRAAAEAERLQQEFQAQQVVLQADAELAARLDDANRTIRSDREVAEQLQAQLEREAAAGYPSTPPEVGSLYGRNLTGQFRISTQQSQSQASDDRRFAQNLQEEEERRAAREDEEALSEIRAWQKKAEQGADRHQRSSRTVPSKANASPHPWTTQPDQTRASQGSQAIPRTVPAPDDKGECILCTDSFPKTQLIRPCEHFYCRGCLAGKADRLSFQKPRRLKLTAKSQLGFNEL